MNKRPTYPNIDMQKTGVKLKQLLETSGYTPRMLQEYLHLSCVQPIYRWYKGIVLPSVDHLYMISKLLHVHMEELLIEKDNLPMLYDVEVCNDYIIQKRLMLYYNRIMEKVA